jgi:hypothetical protein
MVISRHGHTLWLSLFFCSFVNRLVEFYPEIYDGDGLTSQYQVNFGKKWKSYTSIFELANGDVTKFEVVQQEPLEKCLLYLCFKADKASLESMLHKEAMKKS